jgi:hypothetical protein
MHKGKTPKRRIGRDWTEDRTIFGKMLYRSKNEKGLSMVDK